MPKNVRLKSKTNIGSVKYKNNLSSSPNFRMKIKNKTLDKYIFNFAKELNKRYPYGIYEQEINYSLKNNVKQQNLMAKFLLNLSVKRGKFPLETKSNLYKLIRLLTKRIKSKNYSDDVFNINFLLSTGRRPKDFYLSSEERELVGKIGKDNLEKVYLNCSDFSKLFKDQILGPQTPMDHTIVRSLRIVRILTDLARDIIGPNKALSYI